MVNVKDATLGEISSLSARAMPDASPSCSIASHDFVIYILQSVQAFPLRRQYLHTSSISYLHCVNMPLQEVSIAQNVHLH